MQTHPSDPVADLALTEGLVTEDQLNECRRQTRTDPHRRSISTLLVDKGYLKTADRERLVLKAPPPATPAGTDGPDTPPAPAKPRVGVSSHDVSFGKILLTEGKVSREQLEECLRIQFARAQQGQKTRLGEVLVERGYLTALQAREALGEQHVTILRCGPCSKNYNARNYKTGMVVKCPVCRGALVTADRQAGLSASKTLHPRSSRFGQPRLKGPARPAAPPTDLPADNEAPGAGTQ